MESLMPRYNKSTDLHVVEVIGDFKFAIYEEARVQERKQKSKM